MEGLDGDRLVPVSPRHRVLLAREYADLCDKAPKRDFVVRTLMRRQVNELLLMTAELVIAGDDTRKLHPLAVSYPLHFRKTYFPGQLHGDPQIEFENFALASKLTNVPPPIGWSSSVFRSCLVPGQAYARLSPFGVEPVEMNLDLAEKLPLATAAGLWFLAEQAFAQLGAMHRGGLAHGDAELHNCIVCPAPLELLFVDFGNSMKKADLSESAWDTRCARDFEPLLREAIFLQCALGRQAGGLADRAWDGMERLFRSPEPFRRAIQRQAGV